MKCKIIFKVALVLFLLNQISIVHGYVQKEVTFRNGDVVLAGTLLLPGDEGKYPAIVCLHGSGDATRPFVRPLAEKFVNLGLATLIFDKRGSGDSTGSWLNASLEDLAADDAAAVAFLKEEKEIDSSKIGLWAVSQSGWIAPVVTQIVPDIAFLIVISGGGASPRETERFAYNSALTHAGVSESDKAQALSLVDQFFNYLQTGKDREALMQAIEKAKTQEWYRYLNLDRNVPPQEIVSKWSWVATFNPAPSIEKISCPVLLFFGGKDPFQPAAVAAHAWESSLKKGGNTKYTIKIFPEAGHAITMGPHNPSNPVYAEGYIDTMLNWLKATVMQ
ncbi:MAG: hypothetical protein C5B54_08365 [Acidobacteria bacterium]|nr:MAG: hypothetical protein C5B54_08365 [Acidobacteriota bacterium]